MKSFTGPGSTPSRRRFWDQVTEAVNASRKIAGRHVTVSEHPGKGTLINVADTSARRGSGGGGTCYGPETVDVTFADVIYSCSCVAPDGLTWLSAEAGDEFAGGTWTLTRDTSLESDGLIAYRIQFPANPGTIWFFDDASCAGTLNTGATAEITLACIAPDSFYSDFFTPGTYLFADVFADLFFAYSFFGYDASDSPLSFSNLCDCSIFDPSVVATGAEPFVGLAHGGTAVISV